MTMELLVDSAAFWDRFKADIAAAQKTVYVQTLSFEGDEAGMMLADSIVSSPATDRRIIIDYYTEHVLSDKLIYAPINWLDPEMWKEKSCTTRMMAALEKSDAQVKFVNRFGFLMHKVPLRNHKKILIIDDNICYLGGINFSEHNFEWHDMMVRLESVEATSFLKTDFLGTWDGKNLGDALKLDQIELISCDGQNNHKQFQRVIDLIQSANKSIYVQSPYLSQPFTGHLGEAVQNGVAVTVVTPEHNNKMYMRHLIESESFRYGFDLHLYPDRMTHLKAMLIDDKQLVVGSSNFDCFSYNYEQESVAIITDHDLIAQFRQKVIDTDASICRKAELRPDQFIHRRSRWQVALGEFVARLFN